MSQLRTLVRWDRDFQVWAYSVSYSQLLLRSLRDDSPTRVDVLFSNVQVMHLVPDMDPLQIDVVEGRSYQGLELPSSVKGDWYAMNGGESYVFATHCKWHEDDGNFSSPSKFGPFRRTD